MGGLPAWGEAVVAASSPPEHAAREASKTVKVMVSPLCMRAYEHHPVTSRIHLAEGYGIFGLEREALLESPAFACVAGGLVNENL